MPSKNMHHAKTGPIQLFNFNFYLFAGGFIYIISFESDFCFECSFFIEFFDFKYSFTFLIDFSLIDFAFDFQCEFFTRF